jgi:hypothetical protein
VPSALSRFSALCLIVILPLLAPSTAPVRANDRVLTFKIPPVKIPLDIKDQHVTVVASALITMVSQDRDLHIFHLQLTADLAELQQNLTPLLSAQLNKDDRCGDRIAVQQASLTPAPPASLAVVQLHYERYACVKLAGKQKAQRVLGGNAVIPVKLTPTVEQNNAELRLVPGVGQVQADGSLGELLRSGAVGEMLQEKIRNSILSALQKGTNLNATLPPAVQGYASIRSAQFQTSSSGRLLAVLDGEIRITKDQVQALSQQVKERLGSH